MGEKDEPLHHTTALQYQIEVLDLLARLGRSI